MWVNVLVASFDEKLFFLKKKNQVENKEAMNKT